ncbi:MAG: hypothetical protein HY674_20400 [Chloroflexi bacterium]|nr:hypothetical protein [Chloroflexota bacterium]
MILSLPLAPDLVRAAGTNRVVVRPADTGEALVNPGLGWTLHFYFLAAMARRYDGNPNVAFIDVGSFGMWGEGHTGFSSRLSEEQTLAVARRHIDLRNLEAGPPDEAPVRMLQSRLVIALRHADPVGTFFPATRPGVYDVFVSAGLQDGTPQIALPMADGDGQRRYRVGRIRVVDATEPGDKTKT